MVDQLERKALKCKKRIFFLSPCKGRERKSRSVKGVIHIKTRTVEVPSLDFKADRKKHETRGSHRVPFRAFLRPFHPDFA